MKYVIHLDAGHDTNGNPRRAFLVYDEGGNLLGSVDQGYLNERQAVEDVSLGSEFVILGKIPTTAKFYREALKP